MKVSSSFIKSIFNRIAKFDTKKGVYNNGSENNYPELIESLVINSVTALSCKNLMARFITGKGFGDLNDLLVHKEEQISLLRFLQDISDSVAEQYGAYIHVNYNGEYKIKDMKILPFADCRVGRKDSNRYAGKILVCSDWSDAKEVRNAVAVDVYNPNKKVIEAQVEKAGSIDKYNGQILFVNPSKFTYPIAPLHPCIEDADSEKQTSIYKNKSLRKGFFGKMLVVTRPMVDALENEESEEYKKQISERETFRENIQEFIGVENNDGVMHFELEFDEDDIEKAVLFKQIDSNIDDKLFAHTENSVADNIRSCYNNVPAALVRSQDGKLFGSSGEAIKAMKEFYQDQTENERLIVEQTINRLLRNFHEPKDDLKIIPLIQKAEPNVNR